MMLVFWHGIKGLKAVEKKTPTYWERKVNETYTGNAYGALKCRTWDIILSRKQGMVI